MASTAVRPYTVHVPADPPAKLFWSFTVYDVDTRCLIDNDQQRGDRGSRDHDLIVNDDGSVDLHFAPTAPDGPEVELGADHHRPALVRVLPVNLRPARGATSTICSWKLGDIAKA